MFTRRSKTQTHPNPPKTQQRGGAGAGSPTFSFSFDAAQPKPPPLDPSEGRRTTQAVAAAGAEQPKPQPPPPVPPRKTQEGCYGGASPLSVWTAGRSPFVRRSEDSAREVMGHLSTRLESEHRTGDGRGLSLAYNRPLTFHKSSTKLFCLSLPLKRPP